MEENGQRARVQGLFMPCLGFFIVVAWIIFLQLISKIVPYSGIRIRLHRMRGVKIGKKVHIGPMVTIDDVYPNFVVIEDGVSVAGQNFILTHNKPLEYHKHLSEAFLAPVIIKKNAWIAIGVIILPGSNHRRRLHCSFWCGRVKRCSAQYACWRSAG